MKTILEAKIGTVLANDLRNAHNIDGRSRRIIIEEAMRRRRHFKELASKNPGFWKAYMQDRPTRLFYVGVSRG